MAEEAKRIYRLDAGQVLLVATQCSRCQHCWFPPQYFGCERCGAHGDQLQTREIRGSGEIYSLTEAPDMDGSYFTLLQLILDDGPAIRGVLDPSQAGSVGIGDRVEAIVSEGEKPRVLFRKVTP